MVAGDWVLAERCFTAVLAIAPDAVDVMTNLALVHHQTGRHDEAGAWLRRVGRRDPTSRATASRLADVMRDALEVRLADGRSPEAVVRLLEREVATARNLPPFVAATLRHLLATRLLVFQGLPGPGPPRLGGARAAYRGLAGRRPLPAPGPGPVAA
jgi:hypothetical protein